MNNSRFKVLSGSVLKVIALITMIIDHTGYYFLMGTVTGNTVLLSLGGISLTLYSLCRAVGRISFPIFAFLISEGYIHTGSRRKYAVSLLILALFSEIPWNLLSNGTVLYLKSNNVIFTLLFGYFGIRAFDYFTEDRIKQILSLLILFLISAFFGADYGCTGFCVIILMYILRRQKLLQALCCSCILDMPWFAVLSFIPINMYNGRRGFIKSRAAKYIFYLVYPLHLIIIYAIKTIK